MCHGQHVYLLLFVLSGCFVGAARGDEPQIPGLTIAWEEGFLTISGAFTGSDIRVHYLEAYCRAGSTDRDWNETVIGHKTEIVDASSDRRRLKLRDRLSDGVIVDHEITAARDEIDFRLLASNPTSKRSQALWAQPCIRVDRFTGLPDDGRKTVPDFARKCFIFLDGQLAHLPTTPWASEARYTPGQVYRPAHVDRNDVNPRPLSTLVPSNGLIGCFSENGDKIMAVAWQPYQELFLGVATCIHSDFRVGGLAAGERKEIRGKIYIVDSDVDELVKRYKQDFPEHSKMERSSSPSALGKRNRDFELIAQSPISDAPNYNLLPALFTALGVSTHLLSTGWNWPTCKSNSLRL